jgi:hypothetical protein
MPYKIRKLPGKPLYRVTATNTGQIKAFGTTLKKAKAQVRLMYMMNRQRAGSRGGGRR